MGIEELVIWSTPEPAFEYLRKFGRLEVSHDDLTGAILPDLGDHDPVPDDRFSCPRSENLTLMK